MGIKMKCPNCGHEGSLARFAEGGEVDDEAAEDAAGTQEPPGMEEPEHQKRTPGAFLRGLAKHAHRVRR